MFTRARAFERGSVALVADAATEIPEGWVVRTPTLPRVWGLNHVRVHGPIGAAAASDLADRHLGELPYRQLIVEDQASGRRLERELAGAGWRIERNLTMALRAGVDRRVSTELVIEPHEDEALELMARWTGEDAALRRAVEAHRQVVEWNRRTWRARSARRLGVRDESGDLAAMAVIFSDGVVAQIEDVYAVPEARGRGFGRAVVTRAIELARERHELTFIVADDNDTPKQLYAKLGFEPLGRTWIFHR